MQRTLRVAHVVWWSALALTLVALGTPAIRGSFIMQWRPPHGAHHSSDSFLRFTTGAPVKSENMAACFRAFPATTPVLIVINKADTRSLFMGMVSAYLAAPHPIHLVSPETQTLSRGNDAVIFCRLPRSDSIPVGKIFGDMEICLPAQR